MRPSQSTRGVTTIGPSAYPVLPPMLKYDIPARALASARVRGELRALRMEGGDPDARDEDEQQHELVRGATAASPVRAPADRDAAGQQPDRAAPVGESPKSGWTKEDETSTASISAAVAV